MRGSQLDSDQKQKWDHKTIESKDGNKLCVLYKTIAITNNQSVQETSCTIIDVQICPCPRQKGTEGQ
jgi:hypothetical protein